MGTRGTIHFIDGKETIASVYRQMDSYPSGLGADLKKMLWNSEIVNGYKMGDQCPEKFNGMGCLAAYVIGNLKLFPYGVAKNSIGNVYMTNKKDRQEYNYFISEKEGKVFLKVTDWNDKKIFSGLMIDFDAKKVEGSND